MMESFLLFKQLRDIARFDQQILLTVLDRHGRFQRDVKSSAAVAANGDLGTDKLSICSADHELTQRFPALVVRPPTAGPNLPPKILQREARHLERRLICLQDAAVHVQEQEVV